VKYWWPAASRIGMGMGLGLIAAGILVLSFPPSPPTRQEIESQARALGMVYREEVVAWAPEPAATRPEPAKEEAAGGPREVEVYIPPGFTSSQVAELLARQGVVPEAAAFERLLQEKGLTRRLAAGYHRIPVPAEAEEVATILTRREKSR